MAPLKSLASLSAKSDFPLAVGPIMANNGILLTSMVICGKLIKIQQHRFFTSNKKIIANKQYQSQEGKMEKVINLLLVNCGIYDQGLFSAIALRLPTSYKVDTVDEKDAQDICLRGDVPDIMVLDGDVCDKQPNPNSLSFIKEVVHGLPSPPHIIIVTNEDKVVEEAKEFHSTHIMLVIVAKSSGAEEIVNEIEKVASHLAENLDGHKN